MAADPKSVSVEALKSAFKEGATPNEEDYHALIDLAAVGGKALGGNDNIPPTLSPGMGLQMAAGKLAVKVKKDAGVTLDGDGVAVKGDGKTVTVTAAGVGIKVKTNGGLESNTDGLHVKTGPGLKTDKSGLEIKLAEKGALKADNDGLAVQVAAGAGLEIDATTGLKVKLKAGKDNYIESTDDGLAITPQGIDAIKSALKSVSLDALDAAVKGTSQGYKLDSNNPAVGDVEAKIAEKLNEAFTEGWQLTQPRQALLKVLTTFFDQNKGKINTMSSIAPSASVGAIGLYNQDGEEYLEGQVKVYKVECTGEAVEGTSSDYKTIPGIYALVGKVDSGGKPASGDMKITPCALMVLSVSNIVTVVGHWNYGSRLEWSAQPTQDIKTAVKYAANVIEQKKNDWRAQGSKDAYKDMASVNVSANDQPLTAGIEVINDGYAIVVEIHGWIYGDTKSFNFKIRFGNSECTGFTDLTYTRNVFPTDIRGSYIGNKPVELTEIWHGTTLTLKVDYKGTQYSMRDRIFSANAQTKVPVVVFGKLIGLSQYNVTDLKIILY